MSALPALRLPHPSTCTWFQPEPQQYQCRGFGGMPQAATSSTLVKSPAHERMALPSLKALPARAFMTPRNVLPMASPAATFHQPPAQSPLTKRVRALSNASKSITLDMLCPYFEKPLAEVANIFGICMTLMKKICRKNGVPRWPHRQIRGLHKSIWSIEKALRCCESEAQRRSYAGHLQKQRMKLATILKGPASPSSKAAFELMLSEPCSPLSNLLTPTSVHQPGASPTRLRDSYRPVFRLPTPVHLRTPSSAYQAQRPRPSHGSPTLPSIASLLKKNGEHCVNNSSYA
ncbi:unnamed protein product [Hyaloperonospora brassicae]|uniref:RWP-RK domain-containing protein n=1 Tax=Hyaloperonospora brassicae TaxID=162125 RepID=A0AAV0UMJ2_HYABA|nr:unnamed protein product [Hyaloperonospora brassicae]